MENASNTSLRTLSIVFDLHLYTRQIPQWRGAFVEWAGRENDLLHNHRTDLEDLEIPGSDEMVFYRYPLVQYRAPRGQAGIFAINEGIEALQGALSEKAWRITWEGEERALQIVDMRMQEYDLRMLPRFKEYKLYKWLALNAENYARWQSAQGLAERIALLERVLASQIIAFAGGMGWRLPERLEVRLQSIQSIEKVRCHGIPFMAFNISYSANVLLPPQIALGKAVSHGFGWQVPQKRKVALAPSSKGFSSGHTDVL